jgi:hypothetical protein
VSAVTAETIARAFGGTRRSARGWWQCRCPICQSDSLGLRDGARGLGLNCFKLCKRADLMIELGRLGLLSGKPAPAPDPTEIERQREAEAVERLRRIALAKWVWQEETIKADDTPTATYLWSRQLHVKPVPTTIRYHYGIARRKQPHAMVARIDHVELGSIGIHITHLAPGGLGKAGIDPCRVIIGTAAGGAVQFGEPCPDRWLVVGEGIESTLAMARAIDAPGWAALSAYGIKSLVLPPTAKMVLIAADNDAKGVGQRAANTAAARWNREGRRVRICTPPLPNTDWNDVLMLRAPASLGDISHAR